MKTVCLGLGLFFIYSLSAAPISDGSDAILKLHSADSRQVVFELFCPDLRLSTVDGQDEKRVTGSGLERLSLPGEPDLPGKVVLIGIPKSGGVRLNVQRSGTVELSGVRIQPVQGFGETPADPGPMFAEDRFWPAEPAEIVNIEVIRGIRVARIVLHPAQFNPVKGVVRLHRRVVVTVTFDQPGRSQESFRTRRDPMEPLLERMLLNGSQALGWRLDGWDSPDSVNFFERSNVWCRVRTETTGVYRITPADLKAAGFDPAAIDPTTFRLFTIGRYTINGPYPDTMVEVPVYVPGEEDHRFDTKDQILFYAQAPSHWDDTMGVWQPNLFTRYGCYWLTWGGEPGRRMDSISGAGAANPESVAFHKVRLEEDNLCPARSGLLWLWERFFKEAGRQSALFYREFRLPGRKAITGLRVTLYGNFARRETTYHAVVYLNNIMLDTVAIIARNQGAPANTFSFDSLPPEAAGRPGTTDSLGVELIGDGEEEVYLDCIEADYTERLELSSQEPFLEFCASDGGIREFAINGPTAAVLLLDVTDPLRPKRIVGGTVSGNRYLFRYPAVGLTRFCCALTARLLQPKAVEQRSPGRLRSQAELADYYIIAPDEFYPAAKLLAQFRNGNIANISDARCQAVRLSEVYDDYSFGMEEPGAIKRFFAAKRPSYGLLAGDATYDYRNCLRLTPVPGVPAYEMGFDLDPEVYGSIAKTHDAWFADFEGGGSSPDMILGRITCRSAVELRRFLDKVRQYERQAPGLWAKRFLLLADDEYEGDPTRKDPIGFAHINSCEGLAGLVGARFDPVKVYLTEFPREGNLKPRAKATLFQELGRGALLWAFFGHGAGFQLCHERAMHIEDVPQVHNASRCPVAFYGSCGVGRFDDTKYQAIAEELVRKEDGCIATMGASKATDAGGNDYFARLLFSAMVSDSQGTVGTSFYQAWTRANTLYHLFGDPATRIRIPESGPEPQVFPDTFYPGGRTAFRDSVPVSSGWFEAVASTQEIERTYTSWPGTITYILPGAEIFRGSGRFDSSLISGGFVVPKLVYPETAAVPNGRYVRLPNSCRLSIIAWQEQSRFSSLKPDIPISKDTALTGDREPPELVLWADHIRLMPQETTRVPRDFNLTGWASDESGILLAPDPDYGLSFYIRDRSSLVELSNHFNYDPNSFTSGRFSYPVKLQNRQESLVVTIADNLLNRRRVTCLLRTDLTEPLRLDSCLVYPNPTRGPASFTFQLSRAALVSVKIWTIAGRLVRMIEPRPCQFGYNQIDWDGLDRFGMPLPNGVYLYRIDARTQEGTGQSYSASHRDRFIIHH